MAGIGIDFDSAKRAKDARLRHAVLLMIDSNKSTGFELNGRTIRDIHDGMHRAEPAAQFEDDAHLMSILRDLANGGYVELKDTRTHKTQKPGPNFIIAAVTIKGTRFLAGAELPDALIDDGRIVK